MDKNSRTPERELEFDRVYLSIANKFSELSHAKRAKVGAIIVKDDNIVSFGYNGMPSGFDNCCEYEKRTLDGQYTTHTRREVLHAESNAIAKLAKSGWASSKGAKLYCTYSPCIDCAKLIIQAGISEVLYSIEYETDNGCGIRLLEQANIVATKIVL